MLWSRYRTFCTPESTPTPGPFTVGTPQPPPLATADLISVPAVLPFLESHAHWDCGLLCLVASLSHNDRSLSVGGLHSTPVTPSQHFLLKKPDHLLP